MEELLGVHETAQYSGEGTYFNTTVFWVRQDLPYVAMLDTVDLKPTTREHFTEQVRPSQGMSCSLMIPQLTVFDTSLRWREGRARMHRTTAAHSVLCGACLQRAAAPLAVKGRKSIFTVNSTADAEVLATFSSDGSPAATRRKVGEGYAIYVRRP